MKRNKDRGDRQRGNGHPSRRKFGKSRCGAQVVAVMDIDQTRVAAVAAECGGAKVFDDALALIARTVHHLD